MRIESIVIEAVVAVVIARMAEVDVFVLRAEDRDRPYSGDRLPRRLVIIEIAGKPIGSIVASDRGITHAGPEIKSGRIVCQSPRRSRACTSRENYQQGS